MSAIAKEVFDQVTEYLGLKETLYFGLTQIKGALTTISTSLAIRKSYAIFYLEFACESSQCDLDLFAMFDFLRTFSCESFLRIESSQLENNL